MTLLDAAEPYREILLLKKLVRRMDEARCAPWFIAWWHRGD